MFVRINGRRARRSPRGVRVPARAAADDAGGRAERRDAAARAARWELAAARCGGESDGGVDAGRVCGGGGARGAVCANNGVCGVLCGAVDARRSDLSVASESGKAE